MPRVRARSSGEDPQRRGSCSPPGPPAPAPRLVLPPRRRARVNDDGGPGPGAELPEADLEPVARGAGVLQQGEPSADCPHRDVEISVVVEVGGGTPTSHHPAGIAEAGTSA